MESDTATQAPPPKNRPRIYVASLADYNAGRLLGCWIDADQPASGIHAAIAAMLAGSKELVAEDWAIHDYENFAGLRLCEFENIEGVAAAAQGIVQYGPVFAALVSYVGGVGQVREAQRHMENGYHGAFDNLADYVEQLVDDCYSDTLNSLPDFIRYHIDYNGIARDLELSGDVFTFACEGQVHVFDAHA